MSMVMALPLSFGRYAGGVPFRERADAHLSGRQLTALQLHARGYTHEQIGMMLCDGPASVSEVLDAAARALGARNASAAAWIARERGLIV